ncbi:MAG TPA: tetratricopeptide repeat protein [Candidatus Nanoarchaeia archaeon]|nr:tetratricopeptide repeat protein [Candidatus Nanoarchaeia archaeon]
MTNPTISLCMIVKDEQDNLSRCVDSVKSIVDEIIIVDTGSRDKTKEIAKKLGAKVIDYKWQDDFSAARNESLKHATKDWILTLDADELVSKESLQLIKESIKDEKADGFLIIQKNYTNNTKTAGFITDSLKAEKNSYPGWFGSAIVRLFRNNRGFEFEGTVHELVEPSIESKKGLIKPSNIIISNFGNTDVEVLKKKHLFYLELCKKKAKNTPSSKTCHELGVLFRENGKISDASNAFKKSLSLEPKNSDALFELGVINENEGNYDGAISNYTESLRIKKDSTAFLNLGTCYFKKGMLKEAKRNLSKAIILNPNNYLIYNSLGAVLEKLGNYKGAIDLLKISIKLNRNNPIGFYNLGVSLDKAGSPYDAMKCYENAIKLGHQGKKDIEKRIEEIKKSNPEKLDYSFSFK